MKCNYCGYEQNEYSVFCVNCGTYIKNDQAFTNFDADNKQNNFCRPANEYPNNNASGYQNNYPAYSNLQYPNQNINPQPNYGGQFYPPAQDMQTSGMSITSLILGILSIILGISIVLPILATIFGMIGMKQDHKRGLPAIEAKAGLILGIVIGILWLMVILFFYKMLYDYASR